MKRFTSAFVALAFAASGCGGLIPAKPTPQFQAGQSAAAQAASFISVTDKRKSKSLDRVFLSECNVLFGLETGASAQTSSGILPSSERAKRTESKVRSFYYLKGLDEARMQRIADGVCADAETKLAAAGLTVVTRASLANNARFQTILAQGKASPYDFDPPGGAKYRIVSVSGASVFNPKYLGTLGGLSMAFKQASGDSPWIHEAALVGDLKASAVRLNVLFDFSKLASNDSKWDNWASKDTATVDAEIKFATSGTMTILPVDGIDCFNRLGKDECLPTGKDVSMATKHPLTSNEKFYTATTDSTTVGDTVADVVSTGLAILGGAGSMSSTSRTDVNVDPGTYENIAKTTAGAFVEMSLALAASK